MQLLIVGIMEDSLIHHPRLEITATPGRDLPSTIIAVRVEAGEHGEERTEYIIDRVIEALHEPESETGKALAMIEAEATEYESEVVEEGVKHISEGAVIGVVVGVFVALVCLMLAYTICRNYKEAAAHEHSHTHAVHAQSHDNPPPSSSGSVHAHSG
jgi:hypothetical protein